MQLPILMTIYYTLPKLSETCIPWRCDHFVEGNLLLVCWVKLIFKCISQKNQTSPILYSSSTLMPFYHCYFTIVIFLLILNKTTGHQRHFFRPLTFLKMAYRKMEAFFRNNDSFSKFWLVCKFLNDYHFCRKSSNEVEKNILWKKYHLLSILQLRTNKNSLIAIHMQANKKIGPGISVWEHV